MVTYCLLEAKKGHKFNINRLKIEENDEIEMRKFTSEELRDIIDSVRMTHTRYEIMP